jgi:hypothetical protein
MDKPEAAQSSRSLTNQLKLPNSRTEQMRRWYHAAKRYEKKRRHANSRHSNRESSPIAHEKGRFRKQGSIRAIAEVFK